MTVPEHFYRQSGVVPCRHGPDGLEVLLVTTQRRNRWILPKGVIEPGQTPEESARREAAEEAGVEGILGPELGEFTREKWEGTCRVRVFLMEVTRILEDWPDAATRRREWLAPSVARRRIRSEMKGVLRRVPRAWERWKAEAS